MHHQKDQSGSPRGGGGSAGGPGEIPDHSTHLQDFLTKATSKLEADATFAQHAQFSFDSSPVAPTDTGKLEVGGVTPQEDTQPRPSALEEFSKFAEVLEEDAFAPATPPEDPFAPKLPAVVADEGRQSVAETAAGDVPLPQSIGEVLEGLTLNIQGSPKERGSEAITEKYAELVSRPVLAEIVRRLDGHVSLRGPDAAGAWFELITLAGTATPQIEPESPLPPAIGANDPSGTFKARVLKQLPGTGRWLIRTYKGAKEIVLWVKHPQFVKMDWVVYCQRGYDGGTGAAILVGDYNFRGERLS